MNPGEVNISGVGVFQGDIDTDSVKCSGVGKAAGTIHCRRLLVEGVFSASKSIEAQEVDIKGVMKCESDIRSERFHAIGAIVSNSILYSGEIDIQFERISRIREVGGQKINIRPMGSFYKSHAGKALDNLLGIFANRIFKVEKIEGNDIYLENVNVGTVFGQNVTIGPNCQVAYLEYSNKAKVHDSSRVLEMKGRKASGI